LNESLASINILVQVSILADHFFLQRSGELVTQVGFNVVNEIIHTLAFLAAAMVWSQLTSSHNCCLQGARQNAPVTT